MIKVLGLSKTYHSKGNLGPDVKALDNVSFTLGNKGLVFVLGRSGGGKSTLLNLLGGLDTIDSGDISVNDTFLSSLDGPGLDSYRNTYVGFVFQEYNILEGKTVKENVSLALSLQGKKDDKLVSEALKSVSMLEYASRKASSLSGGQKQRVAIARAIVKKPTLLLADEPTGALDHETGTQIMDLLKEISAKQLVIVVSHDRLYAEKYADRLIEIEDGKIIADSKPLDSEEKVEKLPLIKSKIRFSESLRMATKSLKSKVTRLAFATLLSVVSFGAFGVMNTASSWNKNEAIISAIENAENKTVGITCLSEDGPKLIPQSRVNELITKFENDIFIKECVGVDIYGDEIARLNIFDGGPYNEGPGFEYPELGDFYSGKIYGYTHFTEDDIAHSGFDVTGRLPVTDDEIAISNYSYNFLKKWGKIFTYSGVKIGLDINGMVNKEYTVVGVVNTGFKYSKYLNANVFESGKSEYKDFVLDDLKNSFNGCIFLSEGMFNFARSREDLNLSVSIGEASLATNLEIMTTSLEDLYQNFIKIKERDYYQNNSRYYDFDYQTGSVWLTYEWFAANGYIFNSNNGTYTKTIADPNGDYTVVYEAGGNRVSEAEDPNLIIPEKATISTTRREFLDAQFITSSQSEKDSLLIDDNTFAALGDDEIIPVVENNYSPFCTNFLNGNTDASFIAGEETVNAKIKAIFIKKDASNNEITNHQFIISKKIESSIATSISGCYRLIAKLSNDMVTNNRFFDYLAKAKCSGGSFEMANIAETAITEIDNFMSGPVLNVAFVSSIILALFSSLMLMNFIAISMSYGKKWAFFALLERRIPTYSSFTFSKAY